MTKPMNLLIVGTGNVGSALAKRFLQTEHIVHVGSRVASRGTEVALTLGAKGGAARDLVETADVIFLAIPFAAFDEMLPQLGSLSGKIVVDCTNPLSKDYLELTIGHTSSAAEECRNRLPSARIVKAFNAMFADVVGADFLYDLRPQVFLASDDDDAKATVGSLVEALGYEPVDSGPLQNARLLEPLAELIIQLAYVMGNGTSITPAILRPRSSSALPESVVV